MNKRGRLIVVEGMTAAGKTSYIDYLRRIRPDARYLAQPTKQWKEDKRVQLLLNGTPPAGFREMEEIDLAIETRYRQQEQEIRPALRDGVDVIVHRYLYSLVGYYYACNREDLIALIYERATRIMKPNLLIFLSVSSGGVTPLRHTEQFT